MQMIIKRETKVAIISLDNIKFKQHLSQETKSNIVHQNITIYNTFMYQTSTLLIC